MIRRGPPFVYMLLDEDLITRRKAEEALVAERSDKVDRQLRVEAEMYKAFSRKMITRHPGICIRCSIYTQRELGIGQNREFWISGDQSPLVYRCKYNSLGSLVTGPRKVDYDIKLKPARTKRRVGQYFISGRRVACYTPEYMESCNIKYHSLSRFPPTE